jgi:RHS repeat-associated protein
MNDSRNITKITDQSGTTEFVYDQLGRIKTDKRTIAGKVYTTSYAYNAAGRLTSMTYPGGRTLAITRNTIGQVTAVKTKETSIAASVNVATAISYRPLSDMVASLTHGNALKTNATHDLDERLTQLRVVNGTALVQGFAYAYADGMNLTGITDQLVAANSNTLGYSPANRLASASGAWGSASYSYDPVGNRVNDIVTGTSNTSRVASYDTISNRITAMTENAAAFRSYTYDGAGNILTDVRPGETFAYTYNNRNRLSSVTRNAAAWGTYIYNGMEQLVSRVSQSPAAPVGTIHYIYDPSGHLIAEANGSTGAVTRVYIWLPANDNSNDTLAEDMGLAANDNATPDLPLAVVDIATSGTTTTQTLLQVHTDHLGRPTRMTNAAKSTVWSATYKPWGEVQAITGSATQNLRFPGQYFQIETGLAYNWHRSYDPVTGRYTQPDPLRFVDGPSVYAYAGSSPFMRTDREGRFGNLFVGAGIGVVVNVAGQLYANGGNFKCIDLRQVFFAGLGGAFGGAWGGLVTDITATAGLTGGAAIANSAFLNGLGGGVIGAATSAATGGDIETGVVWGMAGGIAGGIASPSLGASFGTAGNAVGDVFGAAVGEGSAFTTQGNEK